MYWIWILAGYLLVTNLWAFILMGVDKHRARNQQWRIPEKMLFLPVFLGGSIGGILGMNFFHHKTRHWYFKYGFPTIAFVEYGITIYVLMRFFII